MEKFQRPRDLPSISRKIKVGCGSLYISMGAYNGKIVEVIATLGKSGGCASAQIEAIGRLVSLSLQGGVPLEECINQLKDIRCPSPNLFPKSEMCLSCPDAFAIALRENGIEKVS